MADYGQTFFKQNPHCFSPMHLLALYASSGFGWMLSGLEHHLQRREHALRKTVVRMPGPSCVQKCWMFRTSPVGVFGFTCRFSMFSPFQSPSEIPSARAI